MARRNLTNRRVLITGASRGIGRHLACELAHQQAHLLVVARSGEALQSLTQKLLGLGAASAEFLAGDITDPVFRTAIVGHIAASWGALDVLVNNAGVSAHGHFSSHAEQVLRKIMEVNFFAATELTRLALPTLQRGQDPLIVNIGSILGHRGLPHNSEYSASKFALRGWSESIRSELAASGIGVLLVSPGTVDTEFFDHLLTRTDSIPWGKQQGISPEVVARQIVRAMQLRKTEIYPNWRGRLLVVANRWMPKLVERLLSFYK